MIKIDPSVIVQGESSSKYLSDKGFSPESYGLNLTKNKGLLYFVDGGTNLTGEVLTGMIVATAKDYNYNGNDAYFVDNEGAFYSLSGTTLTKRQSTTSDTFQIGTSDMIQFKGVTFASSLTQIMKLTGGDLDGAYGAAGFDPGWWVTGINGNYRHPMETTEEKLYIGDVNEIHVWNGTSSTVSDIVLPTDVNIISLRKHPDGKNLIAFCGMTADYSHQKGNKGKIYIIDIFTKTWIREIETEMQVDGSKMVGGTIYVTYGPNVGYFNGNGITFLKKLLTNTVTYSHQLSVLDDILVVADGINARAFGDLGAGKVWWNLFQNQSDTNTIQVIQYQGDNKMLFGFGAAGAGKLYQQDYDNSGYGGKFISNRYYFDELSKITKIEAYFDTGVAATRADFKYRDLNDTETIFLDTNVLGTKGAVSEIKANVSLETDVFQLSIVPANDDIGYKLIRIHHDTIG